MPCVPWLVRKATGGPPSFSPAAYALWREYWYMSFGIEGAIVVVGFSGVFAVRSYIFSSTKEKAVESW